MRSQKDVKYILNNNRVKKRRKEGKKERKKEKRKKERKNDQSTPGYLSYHTRDNHTIYNGKK